MDPSCACACMQWAGRCQKRPAQTHVGLPCAGRGACDRCAGAERRWAPQVGQKDPWAAQAQAKAAGSSESSKSHRDVRSPRLRRRRRRRRGFNELIYGVCCAACGFLVLVSFFGDWISYYAGPIPFSLHPSCICPARPFLLSAVACVALLSAAASPLPPPSPALHSPIDT